MYKGVVDKLEQDCEFRKNIYFIYKGVVEKLEQECNSKSHLILTVKLDFLIKSERIFVRSDFYSGQVRLNFQEFSFDQIFTQVRSV